MSILALAEQDPDALAARVEAVLLASTGTDELLPPSAVLPLPLPLRRLAAPLMSAVMSRPPGLGRDDALPAH